jgi:hypothetical protein
LASPAFDSALRKVSLVESACAGAASPVAALRQHNADYGFDGSFHTVPPRAQALLLGASCAALMTTAAVSLSAGKTRIAALAGFTAAQ